MRRFLAVLALSVPLATAGAGVFEHPSSKYQVHVPGAWKKKVNAGTLLCAGPGGFRVRVDSNLKGKDVSGGAAESVFKSDGRKLKKAYGAVRVVQRPEISEDWMVGQRQTFQYALKYRPKGRTIHQARGFLASGSSAQEARRVWVKIVAYGNAKAFDKNAESLAEFLGSFRWPSPAVEDVVEVPVEDYGTEVAVVDGGTSEPDQGYDSGYGDDDAPYRSKNDKFTRGSKSGGMGFMKFLKRSDKHERNDRLMKAWTPDGSTDRNEDQQDSAAQRMGFNKR